MSEAGVRTLIEYSRHRDKRSFKVWFDSEVMFPLNRAARRGSLINAPRQGDKCWRGVQSVWR